MHQNNAIGDSDMRQSDTTTCVRLGLVGLGYWGPNLLRAGQTATGTEVVAACDPDGATRSRIQATNPNVNIVGDLDALLANPGVEAVVIATPAGTHLDLTRQAIRAGRHVLVEKPLAMSAADCAALGRMAEDADRVLMVGHTFLYSAPVVALRELVRQGQLGDPYYISSRRLNMGRVRTDVNALWNFAPHDVSILDFVLNEAPSYVSATGGAYLQDGIEDVVFVALRYESGLVAHAELSWLSPVKSREMTIVGSKRMVVYDDVNVDAPLTIHDRGFSVMEPPTFATYGEYAFIRRMGDTVIPHLETKEPLLVELEHFAHCIRGNRPPLSDAKHAARVVAVLEAAQKSLLSEHSEPVLLPQ